MAYNGIERRKCKRFDIPGAVLSYTLTKHFSLKKEHEEKNMWEEEFCPVLDISRGGLGFLSKKSPNINDEVTLKISIPGEIAPLTLNGVVRWLSFDEEKGKYQIGIQFKPYGEEEGQNYPGILVKIIALEQKFLIKDKSDTEKYDIES